jgi:PAS domain S-box-containing protein
VIEGARGADERLVQALRELAEVQIELDQERVRRLEVEALFDEVLGAMSDALFLVDPRGLVWRVNGAAERLVGRRAEEMIGRGLEIVLGPDVPATPWEIFERDPSGQVQALDASIRHGGGETVPVSLSCAVIREPGGKVTGAVYAARDVSQTHRLLRELEAAESRWRLLADVGDLLSEEIHPQEALPHVCRRMSEATGLGCAVLLVSEGVVDRAVVYAGGHASASAVGGVEGGSLPAGTALAGAVREGRVVHASSVPDGFPLLGTDRAPRSAAIAPLEAKGASMGAMMLFGDRPGEVRPEAVQLLEQVAARIGLALANARLRESLAELEAAREAARSREDMLAGISHDMKTPLAVLASLIDVLQTEAGQRPVARREIYQAMQRQAQRLRALLQQFLDYSRLEVGRPLEVRTRPTDVAAATERVVATWGGDRAIEVDVPPGIPPVLADPDRLDQVLANLLSNAVKFSPPGAPVRIEARSADQAVEISVIDRGRGISPADQALLFHKFHRGTGARGTEGTGLGLYITRALVEAQGGRITVASREGEGSRFTVTLPAADVG